jgi:predicted ferric reductase
MAVSLTQDRRGYLTAKTEDDPPLLGYGLVALAVAVGLVIYFAGAEGISSRGTWFVIGEVLGITAAVLLALTAILSVRLRPLEWLFGDMTKVYVAHGIVGLTMFAIVTVHPLLYTAGVLPATEAAAGTIVPFRLVVLDWISWILIALALLPTLFVRLPFDLWRYTHWLLGAALVVTAVSVTLTSDTFDTFKVPALRYYLFFLFGLGTLAVLYMVGMRRLLEPKREHRVLRAEHHPAAGTVEFELEPVGAPLRYQAGQFTYVDLLDDLVQAKRGFAAHPYSISSAPSSPTLRLVVAAEGDTTRRIQGIAEHDGARALVYGAYGRLAFHRDGPAKRLWIGGGTGVTPFLSLAEELADDPAGRDVVLVAGVNHPEEAYYADRLAAYAERSGGALRVVIWDGEQKGLPTVSGLEEEIPDLSERVVALSGPDAMIADLTPILRAAGVPHIHSEIAIGPPRQWRKTSRGLRVMRWVIAVEMIAFVTAVLVATIGRAVT